MCGRLCAVVATAFLCACTPAGPAPPPPTSSPGPLAQAPYPFLDPVPASTPKPLHRIVALRRQVEHEVDPEGQGRELAAAGRTDEAYAYLSVAFDDHPGPVVAANLGAVELSLQRWADAANHLAMAEDSFCKDQQTAVDCLAIRERLQSARDKSVALTLHIKPDDARITVNGIYVGKVPAARPLYVPSGVTHIVVEAPPEFEPGMLRVAGEPGQALSIGPVALRCDPDACIECPSWSREP